MSSEEKQVMAGVSVVCQIAKIVLNIVWRYLMKGEINRDWYCNQGRSDWYRQSYCTDGCNWFDCPACHRKWPTPEQFKKEYGEKWSGAYYTLVMDDENTHWAVNNKDSIEYMKPKYVVCACTPWGKPPNDWRPE